MKYYIAKPRDIYLGDISVENVFINESMPAAPGDFVKVYLYAKMYAEIKRPISDATIAKQLGLTEDRILEAWNYWEESGVIKKHYWDGEGNLDFGVEFLSIREQLFDSGIPEEEEEETETTQAFGNQAVAEMMKEIEKKLARTFSPNELRQVISWVEDLKMPPEVVEFAVTYSLELNKPSFKYINKVLENWSEKGIRTVAAAEEYLDENDQRYFSYRRVMKALGFSRNPTEGEKKIMDSWFDDMGFNIEKVLEACGTTAGISNPNIKYVNGVLSNWRDDATKQNRGVNEKKPVSMAVLNKYYNYLRDKAENEAEERRKEIYKKIPEVKEIDDAIRDAGMQLSMALIMNNSDGSERELSQKMERLYEDRAIILTENNFDADYTEVHYLCPICNDTGLTEMGERCDVCVADRMQEAEEWDEQRKRNGKR